MTQKQIIKLLFHQDNLMPLGSLTFFFLAFMSIKDYGVKLTDLDKYVGVFSDCDSVVVKVKDKPLFKQVTQRLDIKLEELPYNFTITTTDNFEYITSQLSKGDTVTIWSKTSAEMARQTNNVSINHLVYKGKTIVDFDSTFAVTPELIIVSLIPAIGLLVWFYFRTKKRLQKIRKMKL